MSQVDGASAGAIDWAALLHNTAVEHLNDCEEAFWQEQLEDETYGDGDDDEPAASPASLPYDGCDTCMIREVLHATWPIMLDMVRASGGDVGRLGVTQ